MVVYVTVPLLPVTRRWSVKALPALPATVVPEDGSTWATMPVVGV